MKLNRMWIAFAVTFAISGAVWAQAPAQPGPEHERLKAQEGEWDATMKIGDQASTGTITYKMDLGGLWLVGDFEGEFAGQKFSGKGLDGYDPAKKKYVSIWIDSMSASPVVSEGTMDKAGKKLTMTGEGPGPDGKPMKYKMTTEYKDKDSMTFTMYAPGEDGKDQAMFSIEYKRKK
jgi:hypothetical protein